MTSSFADLFFSLGDAARSEDKILLLTNHFERVAPEEFGWTVHLLCGGSCKGSIRSKQLRQWALELAHVPEWLFEESYGVVGDLAETIALLVGSRDITAPQSKKPGQLLEWIQTIRDLTGLDELARKRKLLDAWAAMSREELLVFNKLITGGLRVGVSKGLIARALARLCGVGYEAIWQRLAGECNPDQLARESFEQLLTREESIVPYPFFLAHQLDGNVYESSSPRDWQIEWKWDGIRAQIVRRAEQVAVWSRGDELISESFPELIEAARHIAPGTVLDGEIVAWNEDQPGTFFDLQKRLNRKRVTAAIVRSCPVRFLAYDLLEYGGADQRELVLRERSKLLREQSFLEDQKAGVIHIPRIIEASSWDEVASLRQSARARNAEGLMLKRLDSSYGVGRTGKGMWWKWKLEPFSVDAVLLYAQKGHGRRADLYTDYTFGVWDGETLVTFAKAYSGLTDKELLEVDTFVKRNTKERFGPVRTVQPELVFEIGFEAIQRSARHRSGVAVRFPRILRWRRDKLASEADTLSTLHGLLALRTGAQEGF